MSAAIVSETDNQLTLQITINLDPNSMLGSEDNIRESLNQAGELPHFFRTVLLASVCHNYFVSASRSFVSQRGMETYPVVEHLGCALNIMYRPSYLD